jgi:hypothetical protein
MDLRIQHFLTVLFDATISISMSLTFGRAVEERDRSPASLFFFPEGLGFVFFPS